MKHMTERKQSIYIAATLLFMMLFMLIAEAFSGFGRITLELPAVHESVKVSDASRIATGIDFGTAENTADAVHAIVKTAHETLDGDAASESINALGSIPLSTYYKIAVSSGRAYALTDAERDTVAAVCQLEVIGNNAYIEQFEREELKYYEMLAVAQVIRNRLGNEYFPDTVDGVVYDSKLGAGGKRVYQFATSPYILYCKPSNEAYAAVDEVFSDGISVMPENYLYFCATWNESRFQNNNIAILKYLSNEMDYDKIVADETTFYAGVTIEENIRNGYEF